jgi:hypothetical protein
MKMFILKSFCLVTFLFLSTLAGIKVANHGMNEMKGHHQSIFQSTISLSIQDLNTSIGDDRSGHDLRAKRQKLERMNSFNLFSFFAGEISDGISQTSRNLIKLVIK